MRPLLPNTPTTARGFTASLLMTAVLAACGGGSDAPAPTPPAPVPEATPVSLKLEKIGGYSTGQFGVSAAEIPAFDAASKRLFVVNAQLGAVDVLDLANPANPVKIGVIDATAVLAGAEINSVAVHNAPGFTRRVFVISKGYAAQPALARKVRRMKSGT